MYAVFGWIVIGGIIVGGILIAIWIHKSGDYNDTGWP